MQGINNFIEAHSTVFARDYPCHNKTVSFDVSEKMERLRALIPDSFKVTFEGKSVHFFPAKIKNVCPSKNHSDGSTIVSVPEKWVTHMKPANKLAKEYQVFNEFLDQLPRSKEAIEEIFGKLKSENERAYKSINQLVHNRLNHHVMTEEEVSTLVCANSIPVEEMSGLKWGAIVAASATANMIICAGIGFLARRLYYGDYHPEINPDVAGYISFDTYQRINSCLVGGWFALNIVSSIAYASFDNAGKEYVRIKNVSEKISQSPETVKTLERRHKVELLADFFNRHWEKVNDDKCSPILRMGQKIKRSICNYFATTSLNSRVVAHLAST